MFTLSGASGQQPRVFQLNARNSSKLKPPSVNFSLGPVIPGLGQNAIPQGIAYANGQKRILISHYFENASACVSVLNESTGTMISSISLQEISGKLHTGHVGGIAVLNDSLFVASDGRILQYELAPFLSADPPATISATATRKCETAATFCTATKKRLLVGEFAYGQEYRTHFSHHLTDRKGVRKYAWVCGYDSKDPMGTPTCVLSVRQKVQGMYASGDRVFLSISYGRRNRSTSTLR